MTQVLHSTVYRLRKTLKSHDVILFKNNFLMLNPEFVNVDINAFRSLTAKKIEDDIADPLSNFKQVSELYAQGILNDQPESPWLISIREQVRINYSKYLSRVGIVLTRQEKRRKSIKVYKQLIDIDCYAEKNYQKLIQLYIEEGLNAEAMMVYQQCESILLEFYNITPSQKTKGLVTHLKGR